MNETRASKATVRIPTPLRPYTGGRDEVGAEGATVAEVLCDLIERHTELRPRLLDDGGELRRFINVFVGAVDVRTREGLDTVVADGDVVSIVPAVAGGAT